MQDRFGGGRADTLKVIRNNALNQNFYKITDNVLFIYDSRTGGLEELYFIIVKVRLILR